MPKYPGVYKKIYPSGKAVYYGARWYKGKTYTTSVYPTATEASEALRELTQQLMKNVTPGKGKITVLQFVKLYLEKYIATRNIDNVTKYKHESSLRNQLIPLMAHLRLNELNGETVQDYQNALLAKYKPSTAKIAFCDFKRLIRRAMIWGYIAHDPTLGIDPIDVVYHKPTILEPQQILSIMYGPQVPLRDRCLIGLGGFAGLRISEAIAVQKSKIDFNEHTIFINLQSRQGTLKLPKASSERYVPILPDFEPILKEMYMGCTYWLFPGTMGKPITCSNWTKHHFHPILKEHGLPIIKYHALRHGFNKMLYDYGIPQREVMQIMGHKPQGMTWHYDRESVQRLVQVTRNIKIKRSA